ncbi:MULTISPECIES: DUF3231 family protein [Sutcliffiella]|uniref:DUF3231 family protein n=1 Tax=Sutcliffiella TaxID=2837511 RepID=UPI0022DE0DD5|nr:MULTISPECIES: DUF3231 family protein [Sutcliffiella]MED4017511.1 DUF3231 family protein [Sutcliffiella cohnii]WBL16029.1 DUF3231 family protein [Sutcliffiella sp. NC1]
MKKTGLTSAEIGILWTHYMQNSMSLQILKYFNKTVDDDEIKTVVKTAIVNAESVLHEITLFFTEANLDIPVGFTEKDVNLSAPKLFSDYFMLVFLEIMGKTGLVAYALSQGVSSRKDVRDFFSKNLMNTSKLFDLCVDTAKEKGTYVNPPLIKIQKGVEFIEGKKYFKQGIPPFYKRSLNAIEITHLFENIKTNTLGVLACTAFGQTTKSREVKKFLEDGKHISEKHVRIFTKALIEMDITPSMNHDMAITDSTTTVFSDKLIMYLMSVLSASGQGNYSAASTASMRYDLVLDYQRLSVEIALFAKDGLDIMLKHNWMEEPPQALDRNQLSNIQN